MKFPDAFPQKISSHLPSVGLNVTDRFDGRPRRRRDGRGREDKTPRAIHQQFDQRTRSSDVSATRAQRFAERPHLHFDLLADPQFLCESAAMFSIKPRRMRLIDHQPRAVLILQLDHFSERRAIAVHGKNTLSNHQHSPLTLDLGPWTLDFGGSPFQNIFELSQIIVRKNAQFRAAQPRAIDDAGVNQLVDHHHVLLPEQRTNRPDRRSVTCRKSQRGRHTFEGGESLFQFMVWSERAANEPRGARTRAEFLHRFDGGSFNRRFIGQPEIIVRRKIVNRLSRYFDFRRLRRINRPQLAIQTLLAQCGEAFVQCGVE